MTPHTDIVEWRRLIRLEHYQDSELAMLDIMDDYAKPIDNKTVELRLQTYLTAGIKLSDFSTFLETRREIVKKHIEERGWA